MKLIRGIILFIVMAGLILPVFPVMAGSGIGLGPSSIVIDDAMRGAEYSRNLKISNTGDVACNYDIKVEGTAESWISLYYEDKPFTEITIPAKSEDYFSININTPLDAANGKYSAKITVTSIPIGSGSGQAVSLAAFSVVDIDVTGEQNISGKVSGLSVEDQETGLPLRFKVFFINEGNVSVTPQIQGDIFWNGTKVDSIDYKETPMGPSEEGYIIVEWDTTGHSPGDYNADITVSLEDEDIYTENVNFKILSLGSLTRSGSLNDLTIVGTLRFGGVVRLEGTFENTGASILAKLVGEVYLNGDLIQMLEDSDDVLVESGKQETLSAYFISEQAGDYSVKAWVNFGGKKTEYKEVTFNIKAVGESSTQPVLTSGASSENSPEKTADSGGGFPWPTFGGVVGGLIIVGFGIVLQRKGYFKTIRLPSGKRRK